jgi:hypothetical protein
MPWQGDLFIGEPVKTREEAEAIYRKLGIVIGTSKHNPEPDVFNGDGAERFVTFRRRELRVYVYGQQDSESNTLAVAFNLTGRYRGVILDIDCKHADGRPSGRSDPFVFDPADLADILAQVRVWWPDASVFIWDRFH